MLLEAGIGGEMAALANGMGGRIREAREAAGITRSALARAVRVTPAAVWNWETNGTVPRPSIVPAIAKALRVTESFVLGVDDAPPQASAGHPLSGATTLSSRRPDSKEFTAILERARKEIAALLGIPPNQVLLKVEVHAQ
jgi:transcriptional regulator with XRE-family HTH domain